MRNLHKYIQVYYDVKENRAVIRPISEDADNVQQCLE